MSPAAEVSRGVVSGPSLESVEGIGALTLGGFLREVTERFATNEAIVFGDPLTDHDAGVATVRLTYAQVWERTRRIAAALVAAGVEPGEFVGVVMGNRPEAIESIFAAAMIGAVAVPMSTFAPPPELQAMLEISGVSVVVTQPRLLARSFGDDLCALQPRVPGLRRVEVVGEPGWAEFLATGDAVGSEGLDARLAVVKPEDPGLVIFSSGTTSRPKAMLHTNRAPSQQFWVQAQIFGRTQQTRMWTALPLFWTAGFNTAVGATLAAGGCWVAQETFEAGEALALMGRERVTEPYAMPHQGAALAEHPHWPNADLSSLRCVFGKSVFARHPSVDGDTGWTMPVGYGLSETCAFVSGHRSDAGRDAMKRSVGGLLPGIEVRISSFETGDALDVGEVGEITVRGSTVMLGYLGRDPAECFDADGFFHTGDSGHLDSAGELHYDGRATEMIKSGGANISPAEIEVALRACAGVKLARVIGVDDERLDQIAVACVEVADGATLTAHDVTSFLRERIATYKVPRRVLIFDAGEIPLTSSGTKVRDAELRSLIAERVAAERLAGEPAPTEPAPTEPAPTER